MQHKGRQNNTATHTTTSPFAVGKRTVTMVGRLDMIKRKKREEHRRKKEEERRLQEEQRRAQEAKRPSVPVSNNENDGYTRVYGQYGWKWIKVNTDANSASAPVKNAAETLQNSESTRPPAARRSLDNDFRSSEAARAAASESVSATRISGPVSYVSKTVDASPLSDVTCSQSPSKAAKAPKRPSVTFTRPETVDENEPEDPIMALARKLDAEKKSKAQAKLAHSSQAAEALSSVFDKKDPTDPIEIQRRISRETTAKDPMEIARKKEEEEREREESSEPESDVEEETSSPREAAKNPLALERNNQGRRSISPEAGDKGVRSQQAPSANLWDDSEDEDTKVVTKKKPAARKKSGETRKPAPKKKGSLKAASRRESYEDSDVEIHSDDEQDESLIPSFADPKLGALSALEPLKLPQRKDQKSSHEIPASINRYLRGYQQHGVSFLYSCIMRNSGAILGDDMGLVSGRQSHG